MLRYLNVSSIITSNARVLLDSNGIILPGVGAFRDAMMNLAKKELIPVIKQIVGANIPFMGICLGLQILFTKSQEMGHFKGLNLISGDVIPFKMKNVEKIPHVGWNGVNFNIKNHFLLEDIPEDSYFYFVHSYFAVPKVRKNIIGITQYGKTEFASIIAEKNIFATQFHPEKSGKVGISLFKNFINYCKK
jgi:glutamine amidotransferase